MPKQVTFEGLSTVLRNLNKEIEGIKKRTRKGMIEAVLTVRREAQLICPHDTGNLNNSCYTVVSGGKSTSKTTYGTNPRWKNEKKVGKRIIKIDTERLASDHSDALNEAQSHGNKDNIVGTIGFSAAYAPFVHEMVDANFKKPGAQAKFLETPLKELSGKILQIIRDNAKVKK